MNSIQIQIPAKKTDYKILIGQNILNKGLFDFLKNYSSVVVLTDSNIEKLHFDRLQSKISQKLQKIVIKPGEENKTIQTVEQILLQMSNFKMDRKSILICLLGGVVGDLGGFAASVYMRGLDFVQIPTTLLAQVDSSVGGKTGFDFAGIKNLIGTFSQPSAVFCDIDFFQTLPKRVYIEGFAEIIKHGIVWDNDFLQDLFTLSSSSDFDPLKIEPQKLIQIINHSIKIKAEIVTKDEKETKGVREILNFGHTFGHALEIIMMENNEYIYHGEAVAIGMIKELELNQQNQQVVDFNKLQKLLQNFNLPTTYQIPKNISHQDFETGIIKLMEKDKKNTSGKVKFVDLS
jgi:3-dehydroquinate synthase